MLVAIGGIHLLLCEVPHFAQIYAADVGGVEFRLLYIDLFKI